MRSVMDEELGTAAVGQSLRERKKEEGVTHNPCFTMLRVYKADDKP